jgi:hypothetical protein
MLSGPPEAKEASPFVQYKALADELAELEQQRQATIRDRAGLSEDAPADAFDALSTEIARLEGEVLAVKARLGPAALAAGRHLRAELVAQQSELRHRQRAAVERQIEALRVFLLTF